MQLVKELEKIESLIIKPHKFEYAHFTEILDKSLELKGLELHEALMLLNISEKNLLSAVYKTAGKVKEKIYGKRIVLFAPLYLSNICHNNCLYCGFRKDNITARRKVLSAKEAVKEAQYLSGKGYKRLLLVLGEDKKLSSVEYITEIVNEIYSKSDIRILHINAAPMPVEDLKAIKESGVGVYQVFQETYHPETYKYMHPSGSKSNFLYRLSAIDRAFEAGFDDVGIGALFGLYDFRYEVLSVIAHSRYLKNRYGANPHTISVPRLQPAEGAELLTPPYPVSDEEFKKIVAVYRLAVPQAGIVVSTREPASLRDEILETGASQISAGSKTSPGGYEEGDTTSQFEIHDSRPLNKMIEVILKKGCIPSLCTSCYRKGRTGKVFANFTENLKIENYCHANAILTLQEYLKSHSFNGNTQLFEGIINKEVESFTDEKLKKEVIEKLERIKNGEKDLYF